MVEWGQERYGKKFKNRKICDNKLAGAPDMAPGGKFVFCPRFWPPKAPTNTRTSMNPNRKCEYKAAIIIHEAAHNVFMKGHKKGEEGEIKTFSEGIANPFSYGFFAYEVTTKLKCDS